MKRLIIIVSIPVLALLLNSCASNKSLTDSRSVITPLSGKISISDASVVYSLPLSVLDIKVVAERRIERPGPYARYAEDLLGLKDVIRTENVKWTIKGITIDAHEEPDPSEFYVIEASTLWQTNVLSLRKAGLIMDINPDHFNEAKNVELSVGSELRGSAITDLGADEYFLSKRDTAYKLVNVDTAFIKIPYLVEKKQKLTIDQLAERAARRLMEMRDGKHLILTGEANVFPQNEAAINEMNRLEKEYSELFTGKVWRETRTFSYQLIPGNDPDGKQIVFSKFSEPDGLTDVQGTTGIPLSVEFIPELITKEIAVINSSTIASGTEPGKLFYRVPDVVTIKVKLGDKILGTSRRMIYQFGKKVTLPSNFIIGK